MSLLKKNITKKAMIILSATAVLMTGIISAAVVLYPKDTVKKVIPNTTATYSEATQQKAVKPSEQNIVPVPTQIPVISATETVTEPITVATEASTMTIIEIPSEQPTVTIPSEKPTQFYTHQPTSPPSEPAEVIPTELTTEIPTQKTEQLFEKLLSRSGYRLSDIENNAIQQLMIADTYGTQTELYLFTQKEEKWEYEDIACEGMIGEGGCNIRNVSDTKTTPKGLFRIGDCFYQNEQPVTWLNTFRITENTYWIEDTQSEWYNQKIETENTENLPLYRHMTDEQYRYGFVIEYNVSPVSREQGTAVFMCCGNSVTQEGSIAVEESNMLQYLSLLNSAKNPHIIIF